MTLVMGPAPCRDCGQMVWLDLDGPRVRGVPQAARIVAPDAEQRAVAHACPKARRPAKSRPGAKP